MVLTAFALILGACDGDGGEPAPDEAITTPPPLTSPEAPGTEVPGPEQDLARCENPNGFSIAHPTEWHTNPGDVVSRCSRFHPEPFELTRGTDERVAAISARVDPVAYEKAISSVERQDPQREELTIDGRDAERLEYETGSQGLWPEGTPITAYVIDIQDESGGREQTLFVDTVGLETFDYERNQGVLDRMAATIQFAD